MSKLLMLLVATSAFGQTYVRPSKGAPFNPFESNPAVITDCGNQGGAFPPWPNFPLWTANNPPESSIAACSKVYDWSAFAGLEVSIWSNGGCAGNTRITKYVVPRVSSFVRFVIDNSPYSASPSEAGLLKFSVEDAPTVTGPFTAASQDRVAGSLFYPPAGNSVSPTAAEVTAGEFITFGGCSMKFAVVPIPFQDTRRITIDGAETALPTQAFTQPARCTGMPISSTVLTGRVAQTLVYTLLTTSTLNNTVEVCSNISNPFGFIQCTADGTLNPITQYVGGLGKALSPGSCTTFALATTASSSGIHCTGPMGAQVDVIACQGI